MSPASSFFEPFGEPGGLAVADQPGGEDGEVVAVLAGMVEVDDLRGGREVLVGEVQLQARPVAEDGEWRMVADAAAAMSTPNGAVGRK